MLVVVVLMIEALAVDTLLGYEVECSNQVTGPGLVFVRKSRFLPGLSVSVAEIVAVVSVVAEAVVVVVVAEAAVVVVVVVVVFPRFDYGLDVLSSVDCCLCTFLG